MIEKIRSIIRFGIAFLVVTVVLVLLMDQIVMPFYVSQGKTITLQDVRNISLSRAQGKLAEMELDAVVLDSVSAPDLPPYTVIEQQPLPGNLVKKGRAIFLTISKGKEYVQMPNLIGKAYTEANLILDQLNLKVKTTEYKYDFDKPSGVICGQSISPGIAVAKHSSLSIWISNGPPVKIYQVPDLFGIPLSEARRRIREAGLKVGQISYVRNEELTPMTVINQSHPRGSEVYEIIQIDLEVTQ
ncbi:MAG: PASTA domain-containing protein [Candidatus Marinimicrobia bacterium]|nr:PASTA domain-containing protein [Candidatus Neomarinimicrobiota bacterium]